MGRRVEARRYKERRKYEEEEGEVRRKNISILLSGRPKQ